MIKYILVAGDKADETRVAYAALNNGEIIETLVAEEGDERLITGSSRLSAEDAVTLADNDWITIVEEWPNNWVYKEVGEN